ncbi:MAG: hypothetical protein R3C44_21375 [Chloroflexota bacterium]
MYRGTDFPAMTGQYFFADFCESTVWGMPATGDISPVREMGNFAGLNPSAFGVDTQGELYVTSFYQGRSTGLSRPGWRISFAGRTNED